LIKTYVVCFIRDISRKNAENKLNLLSLAASETTDTIIANEKGEAVWANQAYLTGLAMEEVIGQNLVIYLKVQKLIYQLQN
jgi:hypothetical protein